MIGALAGVPVAYLLVHMARTFGGYYCSHAPIVRLGAEYPCDRDALLGGDLVLLVLLPLAAAGAIAAALHRNGPRTAMAAFLGASFALTAAFTVAGAMLLPTVNGDTRAAAQANQVIERGIPGLEAAAVALALLVVAAAWRARRTR